MPAAGQDTEFATTEIFLQDAERGTRLSTAGVNSLVEIVAVITYSGSNASQNTDPITVGLRVADAGGQVAVSATRAVVANRTTDATTQVVFDWRPTSRGQFDVTVSIEEASNSANRTVTVSETAAKAGTLADRLVDYWYVTATFAAGAVLFLVMIAARRRP